MKHNFLISILLLMAIKSSAQLVHTPEQTRDGLLKSYEVLTWHHPWGMSLYMTSNVLSDDAKCGGTSAGDRPEYNAADKFILTPSSAGTDQLWDKYTTAIQRCNAVLTFGKENDNDSTKQFMAEAKFLRAYYYFDFVRLFGNVPLITKIDGRLRFPQNSTSEVYAQIEKDLTEAIPLLPLKSKLAAKDIDRATKGAAQSLLGKVYLYQEKWNDAKTVLKEVIDSKEYSLLPKFADLWQSGLEHTAESIFEIPYTDAFAMDWSGHSKGNIDVQLMGVRGLNGYTGLQGGWGFCLPTQELVDAFNKESDTTRLNVTVIKDADIRAKGFKITVPYDSTGYHNNKYAARTKPANSFMYAQNEIVIRYADVLLMYAEAHQHLGNYLEAKLALNLVRARVKLADVTATGEGLLTAIQNERRLELALESNRYFDLVRWGKAKEVLEPNGYNDETKGLYPIPAAQMNINSLLVQNTGYADTGKYVADIYPFWEMNGYYKPNLKSKINYKYSWDSTDSMIYSVMKFEWSPDSLVMNIKLGAYNERENTTNFTGLEVDSFDSQKKIKSCYLYRLNQQKNKWDSLRCFNYGYDQKGIKNFWSVSEYSSYYVDSKKIPHEAGYIISYAYKYCKDDKGMDTLLYWMSYDTQTNSFTKRDSTKSKNIYNNVGKLISHKEYRGDGAGNWNISSTNDYTFDENGGLSQEIYSYYEQGILARTSIRNFTNEYDVQKRLIFNTMSTESNGGQSVISGKYGYGFTNQNDMAFSSNFYNEPMLGEWIMGSRDYYYYGYNGTDVKSIRTTNNTEISFYPNPVKDQAFLNIKLKENANASVQIFSSEGRLVKEVNLSNLTSGENTIPMNIGNLENGIYPMVVKIGNTAVSSTKLVIIK